MVAEHPGRERALADDESRVARRRRDQRIADAGEHEIADGAVAVPARRRRSASAAPARRTTASRASRCARARATACRAARRRRSAPRASSASASREAERASRVERVVTLHGENSRPASRARRRSSAACGPGLTTTGWPTASRNGRSVWLSLYAVDASRSWSRRADAVRLASRVQRADRIAGVLAVDDLADRAERAVEAEVVGDRLHDLLQRRADDVHRLAALTVTLDEVERLRVDERAQHGFHRLGDELAHLLRRVAAQQDQAVLRGTTHRACATRRAT